MPAAAELVISPCNSQNGKARTFSLRLPPRIRICCAISAWTTPIDYTQQRFEDVARNIDIVLDTIGGETQERSWSVLKKGGILVSLVQPPSEEKAEELGVRAALLGAQPNGAQLAEIAKIIDAGQLAPVIDRILPLSEVRRAHELSQSGHTHGKIALRVSNGDGTLERKQS